MAFNDIEQAIRELAKASRLEGGKELLDNLANEVANPTPGSDPINTAFEALNKSAEETFRAAIETGISTPAFKNVRNDPATETVLMAKRVHDDPTNLFGGQELLSAFEEQKGTEFGLDEKEFGRRVRLISLLPRSEVETLMEFRSELKPDERYLFDESYVRQLTEALETDTQGPAFRAAPQPYYYTKDGKVVGTEEAADEAHYFESPLVEDLMRRFYEKRGIPWTGGRAILSEAEELKLRVQQDPQLYQELVDMGLRPPIPSHLRVGNQSLASGDLIGGLVEPLRREGAAILAKAMAENFTKNPLITGAISAGIEAFAGISQEEQQAFIERVTKKVVFEGTSGPAIASYFVPVVGPTSRLALSQRIVANAALGGLTNVGYDVTTNRTDIETMATDFVLGAFGAATLPEVLWAVTKTGPRYNKEAVADLLESSGKQTQPWVKTDSNGVTVSNEPLSSSLVSDADLVDTIRPLQVRETTARFALEQENTALLSLEKTYREQARLRDSIRRARLGNAGPVPGEETLVTEEVLAAARTRAAQAADAHAAAQRELRNAIADAEVAELTRRIDEMIASSPVPVPLRGAQDTLRRTIAAQLEDAARLLHDMADPFKSPLAVSRAFAHFNAAISGKLPGPVSHIITMSRNLTSALDNLTLPTMERLAQRADDLLARERADIFYVGPSKYRDLAETYMPELLGSHPEWFKGMSPELMGTILKMERLGNEKLRVLQELGYPIEAIEGHYYPQFWETDIAQVDDITLRGKVRSAKNRVFADYAEGIRAGLSPKPMSFGRRYVEHDRLLNVAIGDAFERTAMVNAGLARKGNPIVNRRYAFKSPLYNGLIGDKHVVEALDSVHAVMPTYMQNIRRTASFFKNTAFGLFDMGVFGIQITHALFNGSIALLGKSINAALVRFDLPGAMYMEWHQAGNARMKRVLAARDGVVQGHFASDLAPEDGTILRLIPSGQIRKIDRFITKNWTDRLAQLQFDVILTPVRNNIYEGHLFFQHLLGNDITDPAVRRAAAQAANRITLTSSGAQYGARASFENALATSARSIRAELATIAQVADLFQRGNLTKPERITAAIGLLNLAGSFYAVQAAADLMQGREPQPFNPLNEEDWNNFGYIRVGDHRIAIIKERAIVKAMQQSVTALMEERPEDIAGIWTKVFIGKASPLFGGLAGAAGYGYEPGGQFALGDLSPKGRVLNLAPFSPLFERMWADKAARTDSVTMAFEFFGFNTYDIGMSTRRDDYLRSHNPYSEGDPRYLDVVKYGYRGLEKAERIAFKAEHPEFFNGSQDYDPETSEIYKELEAEYDKLEQLEVAVLADPYKRRDYKEQRKVVLTKIAALHERAGNDFEPVTLQDKAQEVYFATLDEAAKATPTGELSGDDFGAAEEEALRRVEEKYGAEGLQALERALLAGATELDTEYRHDRAKIAGSGYYDIPDAAVAETYPDGTFADYRDFMQEIEEYARAKGIEVKEVPAYKEMQKRITKAKDKWRELHPDIDALLVIWDGLTPRSEAAAKLAATRLGRMIDQAEDTKKKKKEPEPVDIDSLIAQFTR